jgi:isopenicillin N synthase-like dioxygenase
MLLSTRTGTTLNLAALDGSGRRRERAAALQQLEHALRTDGWARLVDERLHGPTQQLYSASKPLFQDSEVCDLHRRANLGDTHLGLTFLAPGEEPLYDEQARKQRVQSFNMQEELTQSELDKRLRGSPHYESAAEKALARAYHSWLPHAKTAALRAAASELRRALSAVACEPLLRAFASLLGLPEGWLVSRCEGVLSDNTSLLRCLEYPQLAAATAASSADVGPEWGVSAHTDFECFSLLNEQTPGLELCDPNGEWHAPAAVTGAAGEAPATATSSSWVLIVGDMVERLSGGYLVATPHRVRPTAADAPAPRRSLVLFQALDEEVAVAPVGAEAAHRSAALGFRRWRDRLDETRGRGERRPTPLGGSAALTQREWTELKEGAARDRLRDQ